MKTISCVRVCLVSLLIFLMGPLLSLCLAAEGSKGPPEGDHGRKKDSVDQGLLLGLIYGDQWVIVRDLTNDGNGQPIFFTWEWPDEAYTADGDFDPPVGVYPTGYQTGVRNNFV